MRICGFKVGTYRLPTYMYLENYTIPDKEPNIDNSAAE